MALQGPSSPPLRRADVSQSRPRPTSSPSSRTPTSPPSTPSASPSSPRTSSSPAVSVASARDRPAVCTSLFALSTCTRPAPLSAALALRVASLLCCRLETQPIASPARLASPTLARLSRCERAERRKACVQRAKQWSDADATQAATESRDRESRSERRATKCNQTETLARHPSPRTSL